MQFEKTRKLKQEEYLSLLRRETAWEYLGYGTNQPDEEMCKELLWCEKRLLSVIQPKFTCRLLPVSIWTPDRVELEGAGECSLLQGQSIAEHLKGCAYGLCVAMTLGAAVDEWLDELQQESMLKALLADALANAFAEGLRLYVEQEMERELAPLQKNWLFGIGYGDLAIELQPAFLHMLDAGERIDLFCNQKGVLLPMKSITGIMGMAEVLGEQRGLENSGLGCGRKSCEQCENNRCKLHQALSK